MSQEKEHPGPVGNPINIWSVFFILFGVYLFVPYFQNVYMVQYSSLWPEVDGKVISSDLEKRWPDRENTFDQGYLARVWYVYKVDGAEYMGHNLRFREEYSKDIRAVEDAVKKYSVGQAIKVKVDPKDPTRTIVEKAEVPGLDCLKMGLGLLFVLFGTVALAGSLKQEITGR